MKHIFIILILISILLIGCDTQYVLADTVPETVVVTEVVTLEVTDTAKIEELELELQKYKDLIDNLNNLLSNVYYVYQGKSDGSSVWATGFSINYNGKYYLITAGHVIDNGYGIFKNLGFKVNGRYIYPELLSYKNEWGNDYAIFYSDKITNGLTLTDKADYKNLYILGLQTFKQIDYKTIKPGESGSPIIDISGNAVGILNKQGGAYTLVNSILDSIK